MLVIRMQRTGRKGHAQFRVVVQDSRRTPTSGNIVAAIGHFDPHSKQTTLDKEKAEYYLKNGAQPSDRVARLLKAEGVKLPSWVKFDAKGEGKIKHPEKLRKNRPAEPEAPAEEASIEEPAAEAAAEPAVEETAVEESTETPAEAPAEAAETETAVEEAAPAEAETTPEETPEQPAE